MMNRIVSDDWDQHWHDFGAAAEKGPGPRYRRRLIFKLLRLRAYGPRARMLELGSGTGEFAEEFCRRSPDSAYLGLELSRTGVEIASRRVPNAIFLQRDLLQNHEERDETTSFGATHAVCSEVVEHVDDPVSLLRNATKYMAPGCRLILTVPGGPMNAFYRHIGHRKHYTPEQLRVVAEQAGFHVENAWAAGFPFFNLFRLLITWRGEKLIERVSKPPSWMLQLAMWTFDALFRMNLMRWGWQTIVVARYAPAGPSR